ncbi:unnamed protein product [Rotaria magnacalcarata]|uniref:Uncharacterized protein n=1 Tax=Rotaria magnacalcarata TaxID=392030 RepID=A0A816M8Q2_9BILA|nr:unnamed protein product [Rotaria magnacalcarata]
MSSPIANAPSRISRFPNIKSTVIPNESPSRPNIDVNVPVLSIPQNKTRNSTNTFDTLCQWGTRALKYTRQLFQ